MTMDAPQLNVAVIGAGLTGLLIAHGLQRVMHAGDELDANKFV